MTQFTVRNPDFETIVTRSFDQQGFMAHLGAELTGVEPGHVQIEVPFRSDLSQQHDYFHAGVTAAIVDSSCGYAALTLMPAGSEVLTVEYKVSSRLRVVSGSSRTAVSCAPAGRSPSVTATRMPCRTAGRPTAPP